MMNSKTFFLTTVSLMSLFTGAELFAAAPPVKDDADDQHTAAAAAPQAALSMLMRK